MRLNTVNKKSRAHKIYIDISLVASDLSHKNFNHTRLTTVNKQVALKNRSYLLKLWVAIPEGITRLLKNSQRLDTFENFLGTKKVS